MHCCQLQRCTIDLKLFLPWCNTLNCGYNEYYYEPENTASLWITDSTPFEYISEVKLLGPTAILSLNFFLENFKLFQNVNFYFSLSLSLLCIIWFFKTGHPWAVRDTGYLLTRDCPASGFRVLGLLHSSSCMALVHSSVNHYKESRLPHSWQHWLAFLLLVLDISNRHEATPHCGFRLHSSSRWQRRIFIHICLLPLRNV